MIGLRYFFQPQVVAIFRQQLKFYARGRVVSPMGKLCLGLWFIFSFIFLKPELPRVGESWKFLYHAYPQIDWSRPRLFDLLRFVIQSVWLLLVPQTARKNLAQVDFASPLQRFGRGIKKVFYLPLTSLTNFVLLLESRAEQGVDLKDENVQKAERVSRMFDIVLSIVVVAMAFLSVTVPFDTASQLLFIGILWVLVMMFRRMPGRFATILMIVLSVTVSCRYIWWRYTSSLNWDDALGLGLGIVLLLAETYAFIVLLLGYFQNIWPLKRKPAEIQASPETWPTIDLFVPTYNEDLSVVRATVYAALGIDWPKEKLKVYILDDGKRDSFKEFAEQAGVGYIRRPTNEHAKAGNINYALKHTDGEFVAIFDCDHIPTRAFFQLTMGWFEKDKNLAMIQTPHHFFSPDPFERNLSNFRDVPNEGNLFYGLIQDGNDLWDATFFCGSCAIIRRGPLLEVGGIAVETVTEDAHTSLRMHRLGYRSAYLRKPLSAGLATETLSAHIGQRIRWARGMAQIFRVDNPFMGKGLRWQQRLCYANAMLHFLSGIPRIIFLLAPLAFLILHTYIIYAPALAILLNVLPHMIHANITNSRMQGEYRYSFWGEVYETVLSWYIARPTTVALFAPHKGTFNVTAKGGLIENVHYDWQITKPYLALVGLNVLGVAYGIYRLFWGDPQEIGSTIVNMLWVFYNLLILGGAVAVAEESKQIRKDHRVVVDIPMSIRLKSGHVICATMKDFSLGGCRVELPEPIHSAQGYEFDIILERAGQKLSFPVHVTYSHGKVLGLQLNSLTNQQQIDYVQCTFARADTWSQWQSGYQADKPLLSMWRVLQIGSQGYYRLMKHGPWCIRIPSMIIGHIFKFIASFKPSFISLKG